MIFIYCQFLIVFLRFIQFTVTTELLSETKYEFDTFGICAEMSKASIELTMDTRSKLTIFAAK